MALALLHKEPEQIEERIRTSRMLGNNEELVIHGGGNASVKVKVVDHAGVELDALFVKGSGSDLATIDSSGFSLLNMKELLHAKEIAKMSGPEMASYLRMSMLDPDRPFPSVETFLHAFIQKKYVDHSHSDFILALTNTDLDDQSISRVLEGKVLVLPYIQSGLELAKKLDDAISRLDISKLYGAVLRNHGLVTWGDTAIESYNRHIEVSTLAKKLVESKFKGMPKAELDEVRREEFINFLPVLRGRLSAETRKILHWDHSPELVGFSNIPEAKEFSTLGPATPDMLIRTKMDYLYLENLENPKERIEGFVNKYKADFSRFVGDNYQMHDPYPSVIVVRGYGVVSSSISAREASIVRDQAYHSFMISLAAKTMGKNKFITRREAFELEYWSPEEAKIRRTEFRDLSGFVCIVTGAASGIGKTTFQRFLEEGAVVVGGDIDEKITKIALEHGKNALGVRFYISDESSVSDAFKMIVERFGGIDAVFNNAGYLHPSSFEDISLDDLRKHVEINSIGTFLVTRESFRIMKMQGIGGSFVFNITKNVTNPGEGMTSYGTSKAFSAQLSRYVALEGGKYGIRSNVVNPDKIFKDSKIWEGGVLENRAKTKGISVDEYKRSNLLRIEVLPEHVANIVVELVKGDIFGATTGTSIPVDGGIK